MRSVKEGVASPWMRSESASNAPGRAMAVFPIKLLLATDYHELVGTSLEPMRSIRENRKTKYGIQNRDSPRRLPSSPN